MLSYSLALRTDRSVDDVDQVLQDVLAATRARGGGDAGTALTARARAVTDRSVQASLDEALGGHVDVEVLIDVDPKADGYERARQDLAITSAVVAARTADAACLVLEYERVLMRYAEAGLTLHDWYPEWRDAEVVAALPVPYERTTATGAL